MFVCHAFAGFWGFGNVVGLLQQESFGICSQFRWDLQHFLKKWMEQI